MNIKVVKTLLGHGAVVNEPLVKEQEADLNSQNLLDQTVLHEAAAIGYARVVGYLLSQNASFTFEDYVLIWELVTLLFNGLTYGCFFIYR